MPSTIANEPGNETITGPPVWGTMPGADSLVAWAPAKVNLTLEIVGKRADSYHAIETLMVAIDLFDTLEFRDEPSGELRLTCEPATLPNGPENLVWKAAEAFRRRTGTTNGATIRLTKRIPHEAGLGGGSSDAATTLLALNRLWRQNLPLAELATIAADVGSDVAFFLHAPAAICTGRGEIVTPVAMGRTLDIVVVKPNVGLSTREVYRRVTVPLHPLCSTDACQALTDGDVAKLASELHNRLQEPAFAAAPLVERTYRRLAALGPLGCQLSGSGSALFALCKDRTDAIRIADAMRRSTPPDEVLPFIAVTRSWPAID